MRKWTPGKSNSPALAGGVMAQAICRLGEEGFAADLLPALSPLLPAASWSVYRTGLACQPALFMSASHGVPDTTQACWHAYLAGPYARDRSLHSESAGPSVPLQLCHITAREVPQDHRACVYEAHGVAERVSIVEAEGPECIFAVNFYRHQHQRPFSDAQLGDFEAWSPALLALVRKHLQVSPPAQGSTQAAWRERLQALQQGLTERELDVCERLLRGYTQDGVAADLGLSLATVKTYRNRAFARLGIHFRNELFARLM